MHRYIIRRLLLLIPVMLGVSFLVFGIMNMASGDVTDTIAAGEMTAEQLEALRESLGLNRPFIVQYLDYLWGLLHGDLGYSAISKQSVASLYFTKFPATLKLAVAATIVNVGLGVPLGIFSAKHYGQLSDNVAMVGGLFGLSVPNFWLGTMLISLFAVKLGWLPSQGDDAGLLSLILPAITIGTVHMASTMRITRSAMLEVKRADYLRTARAKGVPENKVINKHAFQNALIPIVASFSSQFAAILGGSALAETVFSWPGVGRLIVDSVYNRDTQLVTGCVVMTTMVISIVLLCVDVLYAFLDPRIKAQYARGGKK